MLDTPSQRRSLDTSSTDQDNPSLCAELEESRKEVDQLRLDLKDAKKLVGTLSVENKELKESQKLEVEPTASDRGKE
jgi:hypothetical protein